MAPASFSFRYKWFEFFCQISTPPAFSFYAGLCKTFLLPAKALLLYNSKKGNRRKRNGFNVYYVQTWYLASSLRAYIKLGELTIKFHWAMQDINFSLLAIDIFVWYFALYSIYLNLILVLIQQWR